MPFLHHAPAPAAALMALMLAASPAAAVSVDISLPTLTFPDGDVTPPTKGCDAAQIPVCRPKN